MTFPPSKVGDQYNFFVAAYLQVRGLPDLGPEFDPKNSEIDASPAKIPATSTLFGISISFDIVVTKRKVDMLVECKHFESAKPIRKTSREFKQGILEFIGITPIKNLIGYKTQKFLFITNTKTNQLQNDLDELRISSDKILENYIEELKNEANKKWEGANVEKITPYILRACLNDVRVITIEDGMLQTEYDRTDFRDVFNKIYSEVGKKIRDLPPNLPSDTRCIITSHDGEYIEGKWNFFPVLISKKFVNWLKSQQTPERISQQSFEELPFFDEMKIQTHEEMTPNEIMFAISSSINDEMRRSNATVAIIVDPSVQRIFLVNAEWLLSKASELRETNYSFDLDKIKQSLNLPISGSLLKTAIQESYRLILGTLVDDSFFINY